MHARSSWRTAQALWPQTSGADEGRPGAGSRVGYDAVCIVLGWRPLTTAALKGYRPGTVPAAEARPFTSGSLSLGVVEFEWFLGMTQEQLGDCPDFRAAKMGLSPSQMRKLFLSHPLGLWLLPCLYPQWSLRAAPSCVGGFACIAPCKAVSVDSVRAHR